MISRERLDPFEVCSRCCSVLDSLSRHVTTFSQLLSKVHELVARWQRPHTTAVFSTAEESIGDTTRM